MPKEDTIVTELKRYLEVSEGKTIEEVLRNYNDAHGKPYTNATK